MAETNSIEANRDTNDNGLPFGLRFYAGLMAVAAIGAIFVGMVNGIWLFWIAGLSVLLTVPWLFGFIDLVHSARVIAGRNKTN